MDDSPQHQHGLERSSQREERNASAHRPAPAAGHPCARPRARRPRRTGEQQHRLSGPTSIQGLRTPSPTETVSPRNGSVSQRGDLPVVQVRRRTEIEQQSQRPHAADRPGQPQPPRPQVEPRERDERHDDHPDRHVRPPQRQTELSGRLGPHHPQLAPRVGRHACRRQGKEQMGPRAASPGPDQQMHRRQRETRRRDHGPDDRDPAHGEAGGRRRGAWVLRHRPARWRVAAGMTLRRRIATPTPRAKPGDAPPCVGEPGLTAKRDS